MSGRRIRRRDARLVPVAAVAWTAAFSLTMHPDAAAAVAAALGGFATLSLIAAAVWRRGPRSLLAVAAMGAAVAATVGVHVAATHPDRAAALALDAGGGRSVQVEVTAVGKIEPSAGGWRFDAVLRELSFGDTVFTAPVPVLVRVPDRPAGLDLGAIVSVAATTWPAGPGERAVLVVQASDAPSVRHPPPGALASAAALRQGLAAVSAGLPQPGAGLVAGLAVGDTAAVTAGLDTAMKVSSLSHLTAVSGANCALVVGIAFGIAALCGARRGVRVAAGLAVLLGFVVLVSPEPSVVRAAAMATIAMLGVLLGRTGAGLSLLTTAVIVLLVVDPWLAGSIGFALSVAATGALLVGAGPLADGLSRFMPAPLALALSVPLAAQLACGPLLILLEPRVPLYGVLANLLAAPAAPIGTVLGLVACLSAGIPFIGPGVAALAWLPAAWIAGVAGTLTALPGSSLPWLEGWPGVAALAAVGAAVALLVSSRRPAVRTVGTLVLAVAAGAAIALGPVATLLDRAQVPSEWTIAACPVGQGDAVLVRTGERIALIDTGPDPGPVGACLDRLGIARIDLLVLTHFDVDHAGGTDAVRGRVSLVLHGPVSTDESAAVDERRLADLAAGGARLVRAGAGLSGTLGDATWRVLWPGAHAEPGNDASVVVEWRGGEVPSSVFLGDLTAATQSSVARGGGFLPRYDLVKVAHHGSADQYAPLYERFSPAVALVTVGENTYGHPRAEILDLLAGLGTRIARTDRDGLILVWRDGAGLKLWRDGGVGGGG